MKTYVLAAAFFVATVTLAALASRYLGPMNLPQSACTTFNLKSK